MTDLSFSIPVGKGKAHAKLFKGQDGEYGLTLIGNNGLPTGHGRTLSPVEAQSLATALENCKPHWRKSLVWAALGYAQQGRKPLASAMCHPGTKAFAAYQTGKPAPRNPVLGVASHDAADSRLITERA